MEEDMMLCSSCDLQKEILHPVKSKLVGAQLYMCNTCINSGYEPRWTIILALREFGEDSVREYIVKKLYAGRNINASEVIK